MFSQLLVVNTLLTVVTHNVNVLDILNSKVDFLPLDH